MTAIIIEDEKPAAEKLLKALLKCDPHINVQAVLGTIGSSIKWLHQNPSPGLIFMDIELTDGLSFKIFDEVTISCPVIFTTAYDEYWQEAFEYNSIDYLLKPIKQEKLETALDKYAKLKKHFSFDFEQLQRQQTAASRNHKKRFLVKRGTDYLAIKAEDVAYFYATYKLVCLVDSNGQKFILDKSLSDLEKEVDTAQFYRLNRKYLANINAIKKIKAFPKSKLLIEVFPPVTEEILVSQENAAGFKKWMGE